MKAHYNFIVVIPVADRPQHLFQCLDSLRRLCTIFKYDGRISVLVADDSKSPGSIKQHQQIVHDLDAGEISVTYFGLVEQMKLLKSLPDAMSNKLHAVLGEWDDGTGLEALAHKGASRMRNLAYLKLGDMTRGNARDTLIHFIDSDQEFKVCVLEDDTRKDVYAIDYYHQLDKIFQVTDTAILTGKVVGDPPVSPAVMAGNLVQDVTAFLQQMSGVMPDASCQFHQASKNDNADAAYHDMAQLFGFEKDNNRAGYDCPLSGVHDHRACLEDLSTRLNAFFHGEHPTRPSYFTSEGELSDVVPARTVYTGNYVLRTDMLRYFNPFAALNLRMIGPTLGRIVRSEIGDRFVSANLPMLHKRTVADSGKSEFRPGVEQNNWRVELAGEFERQFFGDILLFSVEALTEHDSLRSTISVEEVRDTVASVAERMRDQYQQQHELIKTALMALKSVFLDQSGWWNQQVPAESSRQAVSHFIDNIEHNFGDESVSWKLINNESAQQLKLEQITRAIAGYPADRECWEETLAVFKL